MRAALIFVVAVLIASACVSGSDVAVDNAPEVVPAGSMTELLGRLPMAALENPDEEPFEIRLFDINSVAGLRDIVSRPDPTQFYATALWFAHLNLNYTTSEALEVVRYSPDHGLLLPPTTSWLSPRESGFDEAAAFELGFLHGGIESYAGIEGKFHSLLSVVSGDLRPTDELTTARPYLQIGSVPEGEPDVPNRTGLRKVGRSRFVATLGDNIGVSSQTALIEQWQDPERLTLLDDERYAVIGRELDRADALGASVYFPIDAANAREPELVAVGAALHGAVPTNVVVYVFGDQASAIAARDLLREAWMTGDEARPLTGVFVDVTAEQIGRAVVIMAPTGQQSHTAVAFHLVRDGMPRVSY